MEKPKRLQAYTTENVINNFKLIAKLNNRSVSAELELLAINHINEYIEKGIIKRYE